MTSCRAILVICLLLWPLPAAAETPLRAPFDVEIQREKHGKPAKTEFECSAPPAPVRNLPFDGFYRSGTGSSVVDQAARKRYYSARKPIDYFERGLMEMSDRWIGTMPPEPAVADCVASWLLRWGEAGAFLGEVSRQGGYVRKWSLGVIAMAWLKIRDGATTSPTDKEKIIGWIARWADIVQRDYALTDQRTSRRNNHQYWAGASVALAAAAVNDRDRLEWAIRRYRLAMEQIEADGTLPLELARRSKAFHYHLFSLQALVLIAEVAAANGIDLYRNGEARLFRLIDRTVGELKSPGWFEQKAGHRQTPIPETKKPAWLVWMEPIHSRFLKLGLDNHLDRHRPMRNRRFGGNATALFGR